VASPSLRQTSEKSATQPNAAAGMRFGHLEQGYCCRVNLATAAVRGNGGRKDLNLWKLRKATIYCGGRNPSSRSPISERERAYRQSQWNGLSLAPSGQAENNRGCRCLENDRTCSDNPGSFVWFWKSSSTRRCLDPRTFTVGRNRISCVSYVRRLRLHQSSAPSQDRRRRHQAPTLKYREGRLGLLSEPQRHVRAARRPQDR